jgi:hypothetical protein
LKEKQKHDKGHKKHKKDKKHKKSKHGDDSEDLDQLLAAKFSKLKQIMDKKELKKVLEEEKDMKKSRKRSRSPSSEDERPRKKEYGLVVSYTVLLFGYQSGKIVPLARNSQLEFKYDFSYLLVIQKKRKGADQDHSLQPERNLPLHLLKPTRESLQEN